LFEIFSKQQRFGASRARFSDREEREHPSDSRVEGVLSNEEHQGSAPKVSLFELKSILGFLKGKKIRQSARIMKTMMRALE
jgi:hypothetical protein